MKKYFYLAKVTFQNMAIYPSAFFANIYIDLITLIIYFFVWSSLFKDQESVLGYSLSSMLTYYAVALTFSGIVDTKTISRNISYDIKYGRLSVYLLKPYNYPFHNFVKITVEKIIKILLPVLLVLLMTYSNINILQKPSNLDMFFLSISMSITINFLFYFIIGCIAFWTTEVWGLYSIIGKFITILAGGVIPLEFFPASIIAVNNYLPFKHMVFTPTQIYLGRYSSQETIFQLGIQVLWIIVLILLSRIIYKVALKKYDSVGN